jgi:hypothetical protein
MSKNEDGRKPAAPGDRRQSAAIEPEAADKNLKREDREARLAEALRANLRRRKAGSRKEQD